MVKDYKKELAWLIRDKYAGLHIPEALALDLARLKKGEPIDYVIGWKPFLDCHIDLSSSPLIPRPETEYWAGEVIKKIKSFSGKSGPRILDIFAGSGCVGLAVLKHCSGAKVDFAEKSAKQVEQIKLNLKINKLRGKVLQSDIFSNVTGKYDFILANPPYVPSGRKLAKGVAAFEPKEALYAGADGLVLIKKFLREAPKHLKSGGTLYIEHDNGQKKELEKILAKGDWAEVEFHQDQYGRWRYLTASVK